MLERSHPKAAQMLHDARSDLLTFCGFPPEHWRQIRPTNPIERLNKKIKRQTSSSAYSPTLQLCSASAALSTASNTTSGSLNPPLLISGLRAPTGCIQQRPRNHRRQHPHGGDSPSRTHCSMIRTTDLHGVEKLHRDTGCCFGAPNLLQRRAAISAPRRGHFLFHAIDISEHISKSTHGRPARQSCRLRAYSSRPRSAEFLLKLHLVSVDLGRRDDHDIP